MLIGLVGLVIGFVVGVLFGRKNTKKVQSALNAADAALKYSRTEADALKRTLDASRAEVAVHVARIQALIGK